MKRRYTRSMEVNGELDCRFLSDKARYYYEVTSPLKVYKLWDTDEDGNELYDINDVGCWTRDLTFTELEQYLEEHTDWINSIDDGFDDDETTEEDPT